MQFYSTHNHTLQVDFKEALFTGLPSDNGLYMPTHIPKLSQDFINKIEQYNLQEIAYQVAYALLGNDIEAHHLKAIIDDSINFEAPVVFIDDNIAVLELFHGPSMAFKDFGARFMSRVISFYLQKEQNNIDILVATSGDTGSAVAKGFLAMPGIEVTILFPKGRVSAIQEQQLTTLGNNITAVEIDGVFDDCQRLVKQAFLDPELQEKLNLSSANSINIARLIPQAFYYFYAYAQVKKMGKKVFFSTPSGNFGNLCGGIIAYKMGLPVEGFVASTNVNNIVPLYLQSGTFSPRASVATLSNAMDVGNPSNFERLLHLFNNQKTALDAMVKGAWFTDEQTSYAISQVYNGSNYIMCPHSAIGYLGLRQAINSFDPNTLGIVLATAHPAKFKDIVEPILGKAIALPLSLQQCMSKQKVAVAMSSNYSQFKSFLLNRAL